MSHNIILTKKQIIQSENNFISENPYQNIMTLAGDRIWKKLSPFLKNKKTLFLCGSGKNGEDGEMLYNFAKKDFDVELMQFKNDLNQKFDFKKLRKNINNYNIVIDALFGIGINRNIKKFYSKLFDLVNNSKTKIISVDVPSGVNPDTGGIMGYCINANVTMAINFLKPAYYLHPGKVKCGKVIMIDLGIEAIKKRNPNIKLINKKLIKKRRKPLSLDIHKYNKGSLLVFSGAMLGAARLVALSARKIGSGLSTIQMLKKYKTHSFSIEPGTITNYDDNFDKEKYDALVIGPGLGLKYSKKKVLKNLDNKIPSVIDADALNLFENTKKKFYKVLKKRNNQILTPHHGEFKRIFNIKYFDKITSSITAAKLTNSLIVYKGNDTVIADNKNNVYLNNNAQISLATAGTGDILAGIIGGLLSQNYSLMDASILGVWVHGKLSCKKKNIIAEDFVNSIMPIK